MFDNFFSRFIILINRNIMILSITRNLFKVIIKINIILLIMLIFQLIDILFGFDGDKSGLRLDLEFFEIKIASTDFTDSLLKILLTPLVNENLLFLIESDNKILLKLLKKLLSFKFGIYLLGLLVFSAI